MNAVLAALAELYRQSKAGRTGGARDFTIDYEALLRRARLADGDAREQAEADLLAAERSSDGAVRIDRQARSGQPLRVRLAAGAGEAWLFARLGAKAPGDERLRLARFFEEVGGREVPARFVEAWRRWFGELEVEARAGRTIQPFSRDDEAANTELAEVLAKVLGWPDEALIRYASARLTGDSKRLELLRPKLENALRVLTGDPEADLESFGILRAPRAVTLHGPLVLEFDGGSLDLSLLHQPIALGEADLRRAIVRTEAARCLTVENESVFRELARRRRDVVLVLTSFAGSATRRFFEKLPREVECWHFGDADPAGFEILRDLRERCGRPFRPLRMEFRPGGPRLTAAEVAQIERLLGCDTLADVWPNLTAIRDAGVKGDFEQETLDLQEVLAGW